MKYAAGFCCLTLVIIELAFPILTEVLSTPTPTQFPHGMWLVCRTESILEKMDSAVPHCGPTCTIIIHVISTCIPIQ